MKRFVSTVLIILGLGLILYPKLSESYYDWQQKKIVEQWKQDLNNIEEPVVSVHDNKNSPNAKVSKNTAGTSNDEIKEKSTVNIKKQIEEKQLEEKKLEEKKRIEEEKKKEERRKKYIKDNMEAMLRIQKINLYMPILSGATNDHLNISVSSIDNTGKAGQIGNYSIAGHRSRTYGRHFNRLDELEIGDLIEVEDKDTTYKYIVYDKFRVKPEETWVLNTTEEKEITLITCDPIVKATHRLIVKGKIVE